MTENPTNQNTDSETRYGLGWPESSVVYLTVDYECDYGTALSENTYRALDETPWLVSLLERLDIPLTCFVQAEVLEERREAVEQLRQAKVPVSFHPHSHTHQPREHTDVAEEVATSTAVYGDFFGRSPDGYRFPNGNIKFQDYEILSDHGYGFDASVFPSWRPGHFDNTNASTTPQHLPKHELYEIPFTVYSDTVRIPTALSYCRLLGTPFIELLLRRPPRVVVFNIHMHDIVNPPTFSKLSRFYQRIYQRNADAKPLLERVLTQLQATGFNFGQIDDVYEILSEAN